MESQDKRPILTVNCTHCGKQLKFYLPTKAGIVKLKCKNPECGKLFGVNVSQEIIDKLCSNASNEQDVKTGKLETVGEKNETEKNTAAKDVIDTNPVIKVAGATLDSTRICSIVMKKKRWFGSSKIFPLKRGENIIGRKDMYEHSDIEIDDPTISRRSITITVEEKSNGYKYLFKVNRCTNPIYVNGEQKEIGVEYYIEPMATIILGKTTLEIK